MMGDRGRFGLSDVVLYLVAVAGLAACLTLVFLGMRAVMDVGGFCADGGPYVIETRCPDGVPLVMVGGVFGLFAFGGLMAWRGARLGSFYGSLVLLVWPALFISLGWNFLEYAIGPPGGDGIVLGWLIPGVIFVLMGGLPLLAALPIGHTGRAGAMRERVAGSVGPRPRPSPVLDAERAEVATLMTELLGRRTAKAVDPQRPNLVSELERLADLRRAGDLTEPEFEQAKRVLFRAGP